MSRQEAEGGRLSRVFARLVVHGRYLVLLAWVALAVWVWQSSPGLGQLPQSTVNSLVPKNLPALRAESQATRRFGRNLLPRLVVVQYRASGLSVGAQRRIVSQAVALDEGRLKGFPPGSVAVPYTNGLGLTPASRERSTTAITYLAFPTDPVHQDILAKGYAARLDRVAPARVSGYIAGVLTESDLVDSHLRWVEYATIALVVLIVGLYLRSLLAPLLTLGVAGLSFLLARHATAWFALKTGASLQREIEPVLIVLLLGVVTDYTVFFLAGTRNRLLLEDEQREEEEAQEEARAAAEGRRRRFVGLRRWNARRRVVRGTVLRTTRPLAPLILVAALMVAASLLSLRIASIGFIQALGPALAIVVLISMCVAVTLTPALIAILGRALFWPGLRGSRHRFSEGWRKRLAALAARRWLAIPGGVVLLAALVALTTLLWFGHVKLAQTPVEALPSSSAPERGAELAARGFAGGVISPTEVVISAPAIATRRAALVRLSAGMNHVPGVALALGPNLPKVQGRQLFLARDGAAVRYLVVFADRPFGPKASAELGRLERELPHLAEKAGIDRASFAYAGDTAISRETVAAIHHDLLWVGLLALAVNFLLLALFLRALVAPLFLVLASALSICAIFGLATVLFQGALGQEALTFYVPLAGGVLLLSFGSDYNLFVVGRIWQEAERRPLGVAMQRALPWAGQAIAIAGPALALSFAALAIVPLASFRELAFVVACGVLIDTFLVRTLFVPAMLGTFGRYSWWPSRRSQPQPVSPVAAADEAAVRDSRADPPPGAPPRT